MIRLPNQICFPENSHKQKNIIEQSIQQMSSGLKKRQISRIKNIIFFNCLLQHGQQTDGLRLDALLKGVF